jgi:hypothetical protein
MTGAIMHLDAVLEKLCASEKEKKKKKKQIIRARERLEVKHLQCLAVLSRLIYRLATFCFFLRPKHYCYIY